MASEELNNLNLQNMLPGKLKKTHLTEGWALFYGINTFVNNFSPRKGFLGLGRRSSRDRKSAIEFLVKNELVKSNEDAEKVIDNIKNKLLTYGSNSWFKLQEITNYEENMKFYIAKKGSFHDD